MSIRMISLLLLLMTISLFGTPNQGLKYNQSTFEQNLIPSTPIFINNTYSFKEFASKGTGSIGDPFIIENLIIVGGENITCIEIRNTDEYFIIRNCHLSNSSMFGYGLRFREVRNGQVISSRIENCSLGITLSNCESIQITNCELIDNGCGLSIGYSSMCNILNCWIINTNPYGGFAIGVYECAMFNIENNRIRGFPTAIWSNYGLAIIVRNNTIIGNDFGFDIWECSNWKIYNNSIGWNQYSAIPHGGSINYWNHSSQGNSWSDYFEGEQYYLDSNNIDFSPQGMIPNDPFIGFAPYVEYVLDDSNNLLSWDVKDSFPWHYSIANNNVIIKSGFWNGDTIRINVDGLPVGTHTYTLTVTNLLGFSRTQEAIVFVRIPLQPSTPFFPSLMLSLLLVIFAVGLKRTNIIFRTKALTKRICIFSTAAGLLILLLPVYLFLQESGLWHSYSESIAAIALILALTINVTNMFGTIGKFFDFESSDIKPDAVTVSISDDILRYLLRFDHRVCKALENIYVNIKPSDINASNYSAYQTIDFSDTPRITDNLYNEMNKLTFTLFESINRINFEYTQIVHKLPEFSSKDDMYKIARLFERMSLLSNRLVKYPILRKLLWNYIDDDQKLHILGIQPKSQDIDYEMWKLEKTYNRILLDIDLVPPEWTNRAHYLYQFERAISDLDKNLLEGFQHIHFLMPFTTNRNLGIIIEGEGIEAEYQRMITSMDSNGNQILTYYVSVLVENTSNVAAENCIAKMTIWDEKNTILFAEARLGWKSRTARDAVLPITIGANSRELLNVCLGVKDQQSLIFTTEKCYQGFPITVSPGSYRCRIDVVADRFKPFSRMIIIEKRESYDDISILAETDVTN